MQPEKSSEISRAEIHELIATADRLLELLEEMVTGSEREYPKKRNIFITGYNKWYTHTLPVIRDMVPDRAGRFGSLYYTSKRSGTNEYTYTIQDYIHGIYFKDKPKSYTDGIVIKRLREQRSILQTAVARVSDFSFDMERFVKINPIHRESASSISKQEKLIDIDFTDEHYSSIKAEINQSFKRGAYMATFLLSKELIRNLLIDILRTSYPPTCDENIAVYYNLTNGSFNNLRSLLTTLKDIKDEIDIKKGSIDQIIEIIETFEPEHDPYFHSFIGIPTRSETEIYRIGETVEILNNIVHTMKKQT